MKTDYQLSLPATASLLERVRARIRRLSASLIAPRAGSVPPATITRTKPARPAEASPPETITLPIVHYAVTRGIVCGARVTDGATITVHRARVTCPRCAAENGVAP
jgi:NMD protein affecting ribosome stability and mRNA decay